MRENESFAAIVDITMFLYRKTEEHAFDLAVNNTKAQKNRKSTFCGSALIETYM